MADAGIGGNAVANKPRVASCVPRVKIQLPVAFEPAGAGCVTELGEDLGLCMVDLIYQFFY